MQTLFHVMDGRNNETTTNGRGRTDRPSSTATTDSDSPRPRLARSRSSSRGSEQDARSLRARRPRYPDGEEDTESSSASRAASRRIYRKEIRRSMAQGFQHREAIEMAKETMGDDNDDLESIANSELDAYHTRPTED